MTDTEYLYSEKNNRSNVTLEEYKTERVGTRTIYCGQAGFRKTPTPVNNTCDNDIVLCFTNKVAQNVREALSAKGKGNIKCYTFDSFFCSHMNRGVSCLKNTTVHVDEYSMVPSKWFRLLHVQVYHAHQTVEGAVTRR